MRTNIILCPNKKTLVKQMMQAEHDIQFSKNEKIMIITQLKNEIVKYIILSHAKTNKKIYHIPNI